MIAAHNPQLLEEREHNLTQALRQFDPEAVVRIERDGGGLSVSTVLGEREVLTILEGLGVETAPARQTELQQLDELDELHGSGGCCGGCGCG